MIRDFQLLRRFAFATTKRELKAIAAAAIIGFRSRPING